MTWSAAELQVGEKLNIEIDTADTESGISTGDHDTSIYIRHSVSYSSKSALLVYDDITKKLKGSITITSDMASGEWVLDFISIKDKANNRKFYHQSDFTQHYKFGIKSVFQGTENISIGAGTDFDPLSGVKAVSSWEGDFTDKITCTGFIDTNIEGLYLIKYDAVGRSGTIYKNYRWITVVSNPIYNDNDGIQGAFFNKEISLSLSNLFDQNSITIIKDGTGYSISSDWIISEEGSYRLSFASSGLQVTSEQSLLQADPNILNAASADTQPSDIEFTIDKTSPKIQESYPQTIDEDTKISADKFVKALDNNCKLIYEYLTEPVWAKIGDQNIQVVVKDLAGNQLIQEVKLTIVDKCDIDRDGKVSIIDLASLAQNYNVKSTQTNWNPRFDFNKDNVTDIFDLVTCSKRLK